MHGMHEYSLILFLESFLFPGKSIELATFPLPFFYVEKPRITLSSPNANSCRHLFIPLNKFARGA